MRIPMLRIDRLSRGLDVVATALVLLALYGAFLFAPRESTMGDVQRIFYFHVPFALGSFLAFGVVLVASAGFLVNGKRGWDRAALAAVEVGFLYCTLVLLTGPVWARSAWGVWWTWDARLTSTLVLWLIYASYLFLRTYLADDPRVRRYAAALGILGALVVPFVYYSVELFATQHPSTFIQKRGEVEARVAVPDELLREGLTDWQLVQETLGPSLATPEPRKRGDKFKIRFITREGETKAALAHVYREDPGSAGGGAWVIVTSHPLDPQMAIALRVSMVAMLSLLAALFVKRWWIGRLEMERDGLLEAVLDEESK